LLASAAVPETVTHRRGSVADARVEMKATKAKRVAIKNLAKGFIGWFFAEC
jgi:hypothetical protein